MMTWPAIKNRSGRNRSRVRMHPQGSLRQALRPLRARMRMVRACQFIAYGFLAAAAVCLVWGIVSFFTPISNLLFMAGISGAAALLLTVLLGLLLPIPWRNVVYCADERGLAQRVETLLEQHTDDAMTQLLRRDTLARLAAFPHKQALRPAKQQKVWAVAAGLAVIACVLVFIPNPQDAILEERVRMNERIAKQADVLEERIDNLNDEHLTEPERALLRKELTELAETLRKTDDSREALSAIDQTQKRVETMLNASASRTIADQMSDLSSDGASALSQSLQQAMGSQEGESLMSQMAEAASGDESGEGLNALAEALGEGSTMEGVGQAAQQAAASASGADASGSGDAQSLSNMASSAQSNSSLRGSISSLMQLARSGVSQSSSSSSQQSQSGQQGSGSGQQGGGQGTGQGMSQSGSQGTGGSGKGQGSGVGGSSVLSDRVGAYESIYDPTRLGGDGAISQVQGTMNEGDSTQVELSPGQGALNETVPYNEVIGQYQAEAAQAMERGNLPATLQEWVNRYFQALVD